jgi:iron complex outermembrane receptor protein
MLHMARFTLCASTALAAVSAGPVLAQTSAGMSGPQESQRMNDADIVVTAMKRSENVQKVPAAITAVSSQTLQERGITQIADLKLAVPSLQVGSLFGNTNVTIRGIGLNLVNSAAPGPVAIHIDGVYQTVTALGDLSQVDLERVEVLRGPQGTVYGRNANAGAINFISKRPTDTFEGYVQASYATYNESRVQGVINIPISDRVKMRAVIDWKNRRDGFIKNVIPGVGDVEKGETLGGRLRLTADLTDTLTFDLSASQAHASGPQYGSLLRGKPSAVSIVANPVLAQAIVPTRSRHGAFDLPSALDLDSTLVAGSLTLDIGDVQAKSITGYQHSKGHYFADEDSTNIPYFPGDRVFKNRTFSQEVNLSGKIGPVSAVLGGFYMNDKYYSDLTFPEPSGVGLFLANGAPNPNASPPGSELFFRQSPLTTKVYAGFGDATISVTDRLRLIGGIRINREELTDTLYGQLRKGPAGAVGTVTLVTCPLQTKNLVFKSTTPRAGLQYDMSSGSNAYATFSKGFKDGGFNRTACGAVYKPEKITAYEVGFKNRLFDNALTLNLSAFYYDYTDLQLIQQVGQSTSITNAASAKVKGFEAEAVWQPNEHWVVNANTTLLDTKYSNFTNVDALNRPLGPQVLDGNPLSNAPKESSNIGISYRTGDLGFGRLTFRTDVSHRSRTTFREFNRPEDSQSAYTIINLGLIWDSPDDRYRVRLYGTNVTNKVYISSLVGVELVGQRIITLGAPRQIGAEFRANF